MQWAHRIRRKISAALILAAIFVLVFVKSIVEETYVHELGRSFASVYEDRLVVESYIYKLSDHLFRRKIMIDTCDSRSAALAIRPVIDKHAASVTRLIDEYEKTRLTEDERRYFVELKQNVTAIREKEIAFFESMEKEGVGLDARLLIARYFDAASQNLTSLSAIQVSEGKLLNDQSRKIVAGSSIWAQFETGILIAIGLMIVVLVFESTLAFTPAPGPRGLN